jgi:hypothetical protein
MLFEAYTYLTKHGLMQDFHRGGMDSHESIADLGSSFPSQQVLAFSVRRLDSAIAAVARFTNIYQTRGQLPDGTGR